MNEQWVKIQRRRRYIMQMLNSEHWVAARSHLHFTDMVREATRQAHELYPA